MSPFDLAPWRDGHAEREARSLARWNTFAGWLLTFLSICLLALLFR